MSKEWEVSIFEVVRHTAIVEADNRDTAYAKAYEIITKGKSSDYETEAEGFTGKWTAFEV